MKTPDTANSQQGFTLLELSIVLVVIGLLSGGLFAGVSLIRTYELKALVGEKEDYVRATNLFKTKYSYLPGDFPEATAIWGQSAACGGADTGVKATCDGDGRKGLRGKTTTIQEYERQGFWQHLSNADLVPKQYTGYSASGLTADGNIPSSVNYSGAWVTMYMGSDWWDSVFETTHNHIFFFGDIHDWEYEDPSMEPRDLQSIDEKFDDAFPATGNIGSMTGQGNPDCTLKANGSSPTIETDLDATYNSIGDNGKKIACTAVFRNLF